MDQSISRSIDFGSGGAFHRLIQGRSESIDILFPMFDQMVQLVKIPTPVSVVFAVFFTLQVMLTAVWPVVSIWRERGSDISILSLLTSIFWFVDTEPSNNGCIAVFVVNLAFSLLSCGWLLWQVFFYSKNLRFFTWGLAITRFMIECLMPIFTYSSSTAFGAAIFRVIHTDDKGNWAFVIISFVVLVYNLVVYVIGNATISHSACIAVNALSCFDIRYPTVFMLVNCSITILPYIFYGFQLYVTLIFIAIHIVLLVFFYIKIILSLPYHNMVTNIFHATFTASLIGSDFYSFFDFLFGKESMIYGIVSVFGFFAIFLFVDFFVFRYRYNSITSVLNGTESTSLSTEKEYEEYYNGLGIGNDEVKAITYLHVGFTEMCPYFLNWSLSKFIFSKYDSTDTICQIIQIISFFPTEFRQLNTLFSTITSRTDLSFHSRFLIYQVYRIKTLRQSSSSSDANERLVKLRSLSEQCFSYIASFWRSHDPTVSFFEVLYKEEHRVNSLWLEAIRDYPNSAKLYDEYATFLVESVTEFHSAVQMKHSADLIEHGINFAIDQSFRSLVWSYPLYVKRGILDSKGNISDSSKWHSTKSANTTTEITTFVSEAAETESTVEFEERYGKQILTRSKLRLAADAALKKRTHASFVFIPLFSVIAFIAGFVVFISLYFYITDSYYTRRSSVMFINYLSETHFYGILANFLLFIKHMTRENLFDPTNFDQERIMDDGFNSSYLGNWNTPETGAMIQLNHSRYYFRLFFDQVTHLQDSSSENVYPLVQDLIENKVNFTQCVDAQTLPPRISSLKSIFSYCFYLVSSMTMEENFNGSIFSNNFYCESLINQITLISTINSAYEGFYNYYTTQGNDLYDKAAILKIVCPLVLFVFSFLPYFVSSIIFVFHVNKISSILLNLDRSIKEKAIEPIRKDVDVTLSAITEPHITVTEKVALSFVLFLFSLLTSLLCFGMLDYTQSNGNQINRLNIWAYFSAVRLSSSADLLFQIMQGIALTNDTISTFIDRNTTLLLSSQALEDLKYANNVLLRGDGGYEPLHNFDDEIDAYNSGESCAVDGKIGSFHDTYKCSAVDKLIAVVNDITLSILSSPSSYNGEIKDDDLIELIHLMNSHLWERLLSVSERLSIIAQNSYDTLSDVCLIFLLVGIAASILTFVGGFILRSSSANTYRAMLSQIKRVPPQYIVQDKQLKNFLLSKDEEQSSMSSISRNILHNSADPTLCVSLSGVVEMVNPAVTTTLGFTPEQVLGQPIFTIFIESDAKKVINEMNIILERQGGTVYEDHLKCVTDNGEIVPVYMTLLGMKHDDSLETRSFVIILRNESDLLKRQKDAEEAKAKSENLLYHILPQDVVIKLNRGEKDICFTVPDATIIFIDVVHFSEYAKNLTPQEIMGSLTQLFSGFDHLLSCYNLLLKIKLIGDVYMAAAGLFTDGQNPGEHANQTVRFAIDALNSIDDVNVKLNASLSVRVGVNTGGPIIAGVLGTDKPVFDIIGDTINVASRLQSTDIPGKVQIPQSTYDYLDKNEYSIEQRGEVFLKGKGQVMTYLVSPEPNAQNIRLMNPPQ